MKRDGVMRRRIGWHVVWGGCWALAWGAVSGLAVGADAAAAVPPAHAVVAALEARLVEAIAAAEKSVVAIARVRKEKPGERPAAELRPNPFGRGPLWVPRPTEPDFMPQEFATGVVVDPRGLVLTVYHVLGEESEYYVTTADRRVFRAKIIGADPRSDLAVLAPDEGGGLAPREATFTPIALGQAEDLRKGQFVIALGNPFAIARDGQASASWGIVANLARKAPALPQENEPTGKTTLHQFGTLIQTDAKLNLGTSGGPLVNLKGEMVGLTTAIPAAIGFEESAGYAIPVDATFRRVLETLKAGQEVEYGFLGVEPRNLWPDELARGEQGVRVNRVVPGGPAARAGLRPGDRITHINRKAVHDADEFVLQIGSLPAAARVRLSVVRQHDLLEVDVELTKYRVRGKKIVTVPAPAWRGMRVDYASVAEEPGHLVPGLVAIAEGVLVTDVEAGSPAWQAGLRPGMFVSHVEGTAVRTPQQFRQAVAGRGGSVRLRVSGSALAGQSAERTVPASG